MDPGAGNLRLADLIGSLLLRWSVPKPSAEPQGPSRGGVPCRVRQISIGADLWENQVHSKAQAEGFLSLSCMEHPMGMYTSESTEDIEDR